MPPRVKQEAGGAAAAAAPRKRKRTKAAALPLPADDDDDDPGASGSAEPGDEAPPSPTIWFSNGAPAPAPANWVSREFAVNAAKFSSSADFVRLVGSCSLSFDVAGKSGARGDTLAKLRAPVLAAPAKLPNGAWRTWDTSGEPPSTGLAPVGRLLAAIKSKKLIPCESHAHDLLTHLQALIVPDGPWKCPLARAVARCPARLADGAPLRLTVHVYLNRLAFELIACEHLAVVLSRLTPSGAVTPVAPLPQFAPSIFTPPEALAADAEEDAFTLPALLKGMEHGGYREETQPAGIALPMFGYQRQALAWMRDQEARPGGLNAEFWEQRSWADDGSPYFYFPLAGELRLQTPPVVTGGLLCEQMGLGKTLEMCALIVADKAAAARAARTAEAAAGGLVPSRATLVVVPTSLLAQWAREVRRSAPGVLTVALYPPDAAADSDDEDGDSDGEDAAPLGPRAARTKPANPAAAAAAALAALADNDVVLTTYRALEAEASGRGAPRVLSRIRWRRIALDECQEVRSSTTALAKAAAGLQAAHRWMISGTPLHASVDDLNGELMFLGVWPFSLSDKTDGFWALKVSQPFQLRHPEALRLLQALLRGVAMRHSKRQRDASGAPLAALPPSTATLRPVLLNSSDAFVVKYLEAKAALVAAVSLDAGLPPAVGDDEAPWETGGAAARRRAARTADGLLRLLREACTAPAMPRLPAPSAPTTAVAAAARVDATTVRGFLREVDRLIRAIGGGGPGASHADGDELLELPAMLPEEALRVLMRRRALQSTATDMVRTDASRGTAAYDANRQRAMLSVQERLADASAELAALGPARQRAAEMHAEIPRLRWQLAATGVSAGRVFAWHAPLRVMRRTFVRVDIAARIAEADAVLDEAREEAEAFLARHDLRSSRKAAAEAAGMSVAELREEWTDTWTAVGIKAASMRNASTDDAVAALTKAEIEARAKVIKDADETEKKEAAGWRPRGQHYDKLAAEIVERKARFARAEEQAAAQAAFMQRLRVASAAAGATTAADLDYRVVAQRGFEDVLQIVETGSCPDCTICITKIAPGQAVVTPCVHISCRECMLAWIKTRAGAVVPCPLCRRPFRKNDVIHILPPAPRAAPDAAGPSKPPRSGDASGAGPSAVGPRFSLAATDGEVDALALAAAPAASELLPASGVFPAVPRLFLTHMAAARSALGPKVAALLRDLRAALRDDASAKAVVFSQLPAAVAHVAALLPAEGFPAVRILPGMPEPERRLAVERFNADASVRVFVLHVGTAAAGLTLTAANHMFMLEPFLCASDEAQARNRCHRIGQTKTVSTTVYYTQGTVEERLLAYRAHEATAVPAAMPAAPSAAEVAAAAERRRKGKGPAKRRRDSDGDDASDDDEDDEAPQRKQPRGRRAAPEDDDGLATLSADASRKQADDAKMRFLFGLLPRDQAAPPAAARLR